MRILIGTVLALLAILAAFIGLAILQPVGASKVVWPLVERFMLREPFRGITADGGVQSGLFRIEQTGVSTLPLVEAAEKFLAGLDEDQRQRAQFPVDDLEWRRWANIHISTRQGVGLLEMTPAQTDSAFALLAATLSARGYKTSRDIMRLEGHLADLMNDHEQYGELRYWFTVMGTPSATEPWGWQLDGHHLIINCFVLGDQLVLTPTFMGSEPPRADTGRFAGTSILDAELQAGLALINALDETQRATAIVATEKTGNNNQGELFQDNAVVPYQGLRLNALTTAQRLLAQQLVGLYTGNLREGHAYIAMADILRHWDDTYFSWVGGTGQDDVFYYRIHSPVVMIEYDHQLPVALDGPPTPTRDHVHTV
ncbi:MAG: DUF3500 domain-containing protein, partial [Pseudomonadales bacterium]|nr:DUF3500 domain-containing protein [Pseudomonadales bacterium]